MASPLEIGIALHYWTTPTEYSFDHEEHRQSVAVQSILADFVERGLLRKLEQAHPYGATYEPTDALKAWVDGICSVPYPIQIWTIPLPSQPRGSQE